MKKTTAKNEMFIKTHVTTTNQVNRVCRSASRPLLLMLALLLSVVSGRGQLIADFETNSPGVFPSQWQLIYTGGGAGQQFVDTNQAASGAQSLHLVGASCNAATAYRPIVLPRKVRLTASVRISGNRAGGCTPFVAALGLYNPALGTFGTPYGRIGFFSDGTIYLIRDSANYQASKVSLQAYTSNTWYAIECNYDLDSHLVDVDVNGVRRATRLALSTNGAPTGVELTAGHGVSPTAWFDNLSVASNVDDAAPTNLIGYVIFADQTLSGRGTGRVTFDALYTYFSSGDPREPYVYQKLSAVSFRVTNFDPDDPTNAWSHLLFTFTNANTGTIFDEDQGQLKGIFELFPPSPPDLDIEQQTPANVTVGVNSQEGQMIVVQQSTNITVWSSVATNVSWTGRWELFLPATPPDRRFFRAYVPTE